MKPIMNTIRTEEEYDAILEEIDALFDAEEGTPEMDRLDLLCILVEAYDNDHYNDIPLPDPISAIEYYLETTETSRSEFSQLIQVRPGRLSELLLKQRELSKDHIRKIHEVTKIPLDVLFQPYDVIAPRKKVAV